MSNKQKQESNIPWWAIVLGFIFAWPIGMVLLFLNLAGVRLPFWERRRNDWSAGQDTARRQTPPAASQARSGGQAQAGQKSTGSTGYQSGYSYGQADPGRPGQKAAPQRQFLKTPKGGKGFTIAGGVVSFTFLLGLVEEVATFGLSYPDEWFPLFGFFCAGLVMLCHGIAKTRSARRQKLYLGAIGQRSSVYLSDLAGTAGVPEKKVVADLQRMLSDGILPTGYIDRAGGRLVLTDQGFEPAAPKAEKKAEPKTAPKADPDDALLRQIRAVNDAIPGEEMSRKIDRIEEITRKILIYQRQNPAKAGQLRQFLNYYLPTTLKILNAYAQMDAQGVEGENISAAKARIEGMMDKVVEGFEKQLDQLFQSDALDIASDVAVLERMLDKDGLGEGMTSGL